ncbi:MAG: hypothetical protein V3U39_12330 [Acidimicrobiia bacterium]
MDLAALKAELLAGHPETGAYSGNASVAAAQLNLENCSQNKASLTGNELFTSTDAGEFTALTDPAKQMWVSWCSTDRDPRNANNVAFVNYIFGAGSVTMAALAALRTEAISRAQELDFGAVDPGHVQRARAG